MIKAFFAVLTILVISVSALTKQQTLENLVYPWPSRPDWPSLKVSYNYVLGANISGTQIVKDGSYSYSKEKGHREGRNRATWQSNKA